MEHNTEAPRHAPFEYDNPQIGLHVHSFDAVDGVYKYPNDLGVRLDPSRRVSAQDRRMTGFWSEEDLNALLNSPFKPKKVKVSERRSNSVEYVSDFEKALKGPPEDEVRLLPLLEEGEVAIDMDMGQEIPLEPDDVIILGYFTSFDYVDSIPDMRPLWRRLNLPLPSGDERTNEISMLDLLQKDQGVGDQTIWSPREALRHELQTHCSSRTKSTNYDIIKKFYANEQTVDHLKISQTRVGKLLKEAPVLSYVLLKQYQSFRYYIVSTRFHVLLELAASQEKTLPAGIDIENEAIILHVHARKEAYEWLYRSYRPSFSALATEIAKYGSVRTFGIFLERLEKMEELELLYFTRRAAKFNNAELCAHMIDLFKRKGPQMKKSVPDTPGGLFEFKEPNSRGGGLRIVSPHMRLLLDGVIHAATMKGAVDVIVGLQSHLTPHTLGSILDIASQNNKTKVFRIVLETAGLQVSGHRMAEFIRMALKNHNRDILSSLLSRGGNHFIEKLFNMLSLKAEVPQYPIPDLVTSWGVLPLAEITDYFVDNEISNTTFGDIEPLWPYLAESLSSLERSRESIQEALSFFPADAPRPGICGLASRKSTSKYLRIVFWVCAAIVMIGVSLIGVLIAYKEYGETESR